jgi:hypothetical protein
VYKCPDHHLSCRCRRGDDIEGDPEEKLHIFFNAVGERRRNVANKYKIPNPYDCDEIREKIKTITEFRVVKYFVRDNNTGQVNRVDSFRDFHYGRFDELMRFGHQASPTEFKILEAEKRTAEKQKRLTDKTREALK